MNRKFKVVTKPTSGFSEVYNFNCEVLGDTKSVHPPVLRELSNADIFKDNPDDSVRVHRDNIDMFLTIASIQEIWVDNDKHPEGNLMAFFTTRPELFVYRLGLVSPYLLDIKKNVVIIRSSNPAMVLNWLERAREACLSYPAAKITKLVYLDYEYYHIDELSDKVVCRSQDIHINTFMQMYDLNATNFSREIWEMYREGIIHPIYVRGTYVTGLTAILRAFLHGESWLSVKFLYPR